MFFKFSTLQFHEDEWQAIWDIENMLFAALVEDAERLNALTIDKIEKRIRTILRHFFRSKNARQMAEMIIKDALVQIELMRPNVVDLKTLFDQLGLVEHLKTLLAQSPAFREYLRKKSN
jgi:hypothetical protein